MNYYRILKVKPNATTREIKIAYKKIAKTHHPDITKSFWKLKKFEKVLKAYEVLSNHKTRWIYDHTGKTDPSFECSLSEEELKSVYDQDE